MVITTITITAITLNSYLIDYFWIGKIKALFYFHLLFLWYFSFLMKIWFSDLRHFPSLRGTSVMFLGRKLYYSEFTHFHFSEKVIISLHFHGCRILVWYFFFLPVILNMPLHSLPPFIVSDEISDVILIFLLSKVYPYSLPHSLKIFFAFGF